MASEIRSIWVQNPFLLLASCVIPGKLFCLCPSFVKWREKGLSYGVVVRLWWNDVCRHVSHHLTSSKFSIHGSYYQHCIKYHYISFIQDSLEMVHSVIYSTDIYQEATLCHIYARYKYRMYVYERKQCMLIIYYRPYPILGIFRDMSFQMFKLVLEKAEEPEIKLPASSGSSKN